MNQEAQDSSPKSGSLRPISVLLVDDQRFIGLALQRLLATEPDIELHCCETASDAVARANAIRPRVILQDLVMPGIDGLTLVGLFRQNPITAQTPIIVLSGNEDANSRAQSLAAGANDYLLKLPGKDELIACLRRHAGADNNTQDVAVPRQSTAGRGKGQDPTLDLHVIALFCEGTTGGELSSFARMLIDQFIQEAETRVATLREAAGGHDVEILRMTAHSLKGSSMTVGARRLGGLCRQLEDGLDKDPGSLVPASLMTAIDEEFVMVRKALGKL